MDILSQLKRFEERASKQLLLIPVVALVSIGCVETVVLSPTIQPDVFLDHKLPFSTAVICDPDLLNFVEQAQSRGATESVISYQIEIGETLCDTLTRSVRVAYDSAVRRGRDPRIGEFDRVLRFALDSSGLDIELQDDDGAGVKSRVTHTLCVSVEAYDRELRLLSRSALTGTGIASGDGIATRHVVREAAEGALQRIADGFAKLLDAGLAEPQPPAPTKRAAPSGVERPAPASPRRWDLYPYDP
jgi:hypothetical protein